MNQTECVAGQMETANVKAEKIEKAEFGHLLEVKSSSECIIFYANRSIFNLI